MPECIVCLKQSNYVCETCKKYICHECNVDMITKEKNREFFLGQFIFCSSNCMYNMIFNNLYSYRFVFAFLGDRDKISTMYTPLLYKQQEQINYYRKPKQKTINLEKTTPFDSCNKRYYKYYY